MTLGASTDSLPKLAAGATENEDAGELLCVVAFTRHGDRTPKQKLKFITSEPSLLSLISEHSESAREELKIKNIRLMEELTQACHLPKSPHISPYLPTSPHISSHLPRSYALL